MITVEQAFERIVSKAPPLATEKVEVAKASGRVIAAPIAARRSQPAANMSAMDGYAVRSEDLSGALTKFELIGESAAGHPFNGTVAKGQTVRIFTGAVLPDGADQVVIQENVEAGDGLVTTSVAANAFSNIREMGSDFLEKQTVLDAGTYMSAKSIGLAASSGQAHLMVHRRPRVAILSTGDELARPDKPSFSRYDTVNSCSPQLQALLEETGAEVCFVGQAGDTLEALSAAIRDNNTADILVTIGGASVGDKDFVQQALVSEGMELDFWQVAMRPGKPLIFGKKNQQYVLGLPGNPASAFVCALLFLRPLIDKLMGRPAPLPGGVSIPVATNLPANGPRQHYIRARLVGSPGDRMADPAASQDSSLSTVLAQCDGLIIRPINDEPVSAGSRVAFLPF